MHAWPEACASSITPQCIHARTHSQWFFSDSTGVEQFVEEFAKKNKDVFDLEAEEHKLEYTKVYNDFQDQFEKKIEVTSIRPLWFLTSGQKPYATGGTPERRRSNPARQPKVRADPMGMGSLSKLVYRAHVSFLLLLPVTGFFDGARAYKRRLAGGSEGGAGEKSRRCAGNGYRGGNTGDAGV